MSKFPVEISDNEGQIDAINYLLSGPSGLGQNFAGFSSYAQAWLTGNYRTPFSWPTIRNLYVATINLSTSEFIDSRTLKFTFAAPAGSPPFEQGNPVNISGVSNSFYNDDYTNIGVVECTTTYCTVRLSREFPIEAPGTGGTISLNLNDTFSSTDCNARVTVTGATDRVFISGQLDQAITYTVPSGTGELTVYVAVNRYRGFINDDAVNPDYLFVLDGTVAEKDYVRPGLTGTATLPLIETIFSTLIDQPTTLNNPDNSGYIGPWTAYYWYILEVKWESTGTDPVYVTSDKFGLRSLSSQVVKQ
jgi:hypothetical protein